MNTVLDYNTTSQQAVDILRQAFGPNVAISTDEGWQGRVHVKIVSDKFDKKTSHERQDMVWNVLRERLGPDAQAVSLVLALSLDEI